MEKLKKLKITTDIAKLHENLAHSVVPGVYAIIPKEDIVVPAANWREYHRKIQELCACMWIHKRKTKGKEG